MTWIAEHWDHTPYTLPAPTAFTLDLGLGNPCDAFSLTCPWQEGQEALLPGLYRLRLSKDGVTAFYGVVDECECLWSEAGTQLHLRGRGLQALLLDNQAEGVDFSVLTQDELLRRYVSPYGIKTQGGALPPVPGFSVETGSSCWDILRRFARYYGGVTPRFDPQGRLLLAPLSETPKRVLRELPILRLSLRHQRYGAYSQVTVVNRVLKTRETIHDQTFEKQGGSMGLVITMPRKTGSQAMRYNGKHRLMASAKERLVAELRLSGAIEATPGEVIRVECGPSTLHGSWRVAECRLRLDEKGLCTELCLLPPDAYV